MFIFCPSSLLYFIFFFFFSSRRRHTRWNCDWSSDVCSSDLACGSDGEAPSSGLRSGVVQAAPMLRAEFSATQSLNAEQLGEPAGTRQLFRSEERRVGKECRSRWSPDH